MLEVICECVKNFEHNSTNARQIFHQAHLSNTVFKQNTFIGLWTWKACFYRNNINWEEDCFVRHVLDYLTYPVSICCRLVGPPSTVWPRPSVALSCWAKAKELLGSNTHRRAIKQPPAIYKPFVVSNNSKLYFRVVRETRDLGRLSARGKFFTAPETKILSWEALS